MARTTEQTVFESHLAPVLDSAYGTALYLTGTPEAAEALIETAAVHAFSQFRRFQPGTPFRFWFLGIVTDMFTEQDRTADAAAQRHASSADADHFSPADPDGALLSPGQLRRLDPELIRQALAHLPAEHRTVCVLYFMHDFSYAELADMLRCPIETIRARLHSGRRALKRLLHEMTIDGPRREGPGRNSANCRTGLPLATVC